MAKANGIAGIEQHVEKAVLAFCALVFVYALFHWGSSPAVEFAPSQSQDSISPSQVDDYLLKQAGKAEAKILGFTPAPINIPDYLAPLFASIKNAQSVESLMRNGEDLSSACLGLPVVEEYNPTITLAEIESIMPAPPKPMVKAVRVMQNQANSGDVNQACGVTAYPYMELIKQWNEKLRATHVTLSVLPVEQIVEVQEQNPDGAWSEIRPAKLQPIMKDSSGNAITLPQVPPYDGSNADAVRNALQMLATNEYQQMVFQPEYPTILWPRPPQWVSWRVNLPPSSLSEGMALAQGTPVENASNANPAPAPMPSAAPAAPAMPGPAMPMPGGISPRDMEEARRMMMSRGPRMPTGPGMDPGRPMPPQPGPAPVAPRPAPLVMGATAGQAVDNLQPMISIEPPLAKQKDELGKLLAWFCDSSLENGKLYRFRIRIKMVNPLLTYDSDIKNPEEAKQAYVHTPWSAWSTPVSVPHFAQMFLTSYSGSPVFNGTVTIFAKSHGQVVKQQMSVLPGDPIGRPAKVEVTDPVKQEKISDDVNFATGNVVIALNFDQPIYRGPVPKKTLEMIYLDANGQLQSRLLEVDRELQDFRDLDDLAKTPVTNKTAAKPTNP